MKKIVLAACLFFLSSSSYAALSALNQSLVEMKSLLESQEWNQQLPQAESIKAVFHTDTGYIVFTNNYQMFVEVQYTKQNRPGPQTYQLIFNKPMKLTAP